MTIIRLAITTSSAGDGLSNTIFFLQLQMLLIINSTETKERLYGARPNVNRRETMCFSSTLNKAHKGKHAKETTDGQLFIPIRDGMSSSAAFRR